jgi:hypothetical protein
MWRSIASVVGGIVAWALIVTCLNFALRAVLPGYQEAEPEMHFTLAMQLGRLLIAAITSFAAGAIVRVIAPDSRLAPWMTGGIILALFIPQHIRLWDHFPVWYHLAFLVPLVPLFVAGAWATSKANARR